MTLVVDKFESLIPFHRKSTPSGWTIFNAPCCHHRGHNPDVKRRAGVRFDQGVIFNCFNCKFITGWQPGFPLGEKMKTLCRWMGASDDDIKLMIFEALKSQRSDDYAGPYYPTEQFTEKSLPESSLPLSLWAEVVNDMEDTDRVKFLEVVKYAQDRGFNDPFDQDFYWSPESGYDDRLIIPFKNRGKIVGSTARKIKEGKPKYLSDQHPHFVFNMDAQKESQRYVLVTEGPFDALNIGGIALLTNSISDQQADTINRLNSEIIVIPDQDRAGLNVIDKAADLGWSVSFPNWESDVKDPADAVKRYGKLFVIVDAIKTAQKGKIKINMYKKILEKKIKSIEDQ